MAATYTVVVLTEQGKPLEGLFRPGETEGLVVSYTADLDSLDALEGPDVALLPLDVLAGVNARQLVGRCHQEGLPVVALLSAQRLGEYDFSLGADDFVLLPARQGELAARVEQVVRRLRKDSGEQVIKAGDLVIDQERYEVSLGPRKVLLTFKEYQLLVLLASNPGRVYTREALLSQVWGYDYFGGTRTVDVHIRRLRAKIEDAGHSFIETVWNVGYRFRA